MTEVLINGIPYIPVTEASPAVRIGVGVCTHNMREIASESITRLKEHLPAGAVLVIVDDASDTPYDGATYRFEKQAGIAKAKNKCLELLYAEGVEHFFLFDDDTYPLTPDWWKPYVESSEPHLMYVFPYSGGPPVVATDYHHKAWAQPCGCMLYMHRSVLNTVGGMDLAYGTWGHEHLDYSNRIFNAGLSTWRFADVIGSEKLLYCADQKGTTRSVDKTTRDAHLAKNASYYETQIASKAYHEFREQRNVVIAAWQHGPDIQRANKVTQTKANVAAKALAESVVGADFVLLADDGQGTELVNDLGIGIYLSRWVHYYQYLRSHPEIQWAFCVDANDVEMLQPPWAHMQAGVLYCGYEPTILDIPWMHTHHPSERLQAFFRANATRTLLNCGVVGADRNTLLAFLHDWIRLIEENTADRWKGDEKAVLGADMGPFNYLAYSKWADRLETGPRVVSLFKKEERNSWSWWKHK
jgi:glycosyltransferase involved in cell wall biosynthesis